MGMKKPITNFGDWEWECNTVFPTQLGKELTKDHWEKLRTGIPAPAWDQCVKMFEILGGTIGGLTKLKSLKALFACIEGDLGLTDPF